MLELSDMSYKVFRVSKLLSDLPSYNQILETFRHIPITVCVFLFLPSSQLKICSFLSTFDVSRVTLQHL